MFIVTEDTNHAYRPRTAAVAQSHLQAHVHIVQNNHPVASLQLLRPVFSVL